MLAASVLMLRPIDLEKAGARHPASSRSVWKIPVDGLIVGIITGLVGVGGGFLVVPALVLLGGLSMRQAVGTSLVIIALKSFSGFYKYQDVLVAQELSLDWEIIGLVTALGIAGSLAGNLIGGLIPQDKLKKGFGVFLIIMGGYILVKSAPALL